MVDSGIKVDQALIEELQQMKELKKSPYSCILMQIRQIDPEAKKVGSISPPEAIFKLSAVKIEEEEESSGVDPVYKYLLKEITDNYKDTPIFAAMYINFGSQGKLCAMGWAPDSAPMKPKMKISSSFDSLKKKIPNLNYNAIINDYDELKNFDEFKSKLTKK